MISFVGLLTVLFSVAEAQRNYICPAPTGSFPDFTSTGCTRFWRCINCVPSRGTCANGQQFDYNRTICDRDENVECNEQRRHYQPLLGAPQCRLSAFNPGFPPQNIPGFGFGRGPLFIPIQPRQDQGVIITLPPVNPPINSQQCLYIQNQINNLFSQVIQRATGQRCPSLRCPLQILIVQC